MTWLITLPLPLKPRSPLCAVCGLWEGVNPGFTPSFIDFDGQYVASFGVDLLPTWQQKGHRCLCPRGRHLPLQKPWATMTPLHTSLPELKGIFKSRIILDFNFFSFPHCFFLISPQWDITLITAVKGNSVSITVCHPSPLGLSTWNLSPKWKEGRKGKKPNMQILDFIYLPFFSHAMSSRKESIFLSLLLLCFFPIIWAVIWV